VGIDRTWNLLHDHPHIITVETTEGNLYTIRYPQCHLGTYYNGYQNPTLHPRRDTWATLSVADRVVDPTVRVSSAFKL
jgi:hypothetical protein